MANIAAVAPTGHESCDSACSYMRKCLGEVLEQFPEALRGNLYQKFEEEYKNPMTKDLEFLVRKRLTDEEARNIQFEPSALQYRYYAPVISLAFAEPSIISSGSSHPWKILQKRFLTMLYLKHARNWPLVTEFILQDGLQILADLFLSPDFQMRGQAIDSFIQMTSHPSFDWFVEPNGYEQKLLHSKMLELSNPSSNFLRQLIANVMGLENDLKDQELLKEKAQKFPGGSYVILQILAFYLSWVRKLHSSNNELRLSRQLLNILRDWETLNQVENAEMIPEEKELAQKVYEDFSRWPAIDEDNNTTNDMTQKPLVSVDTVHEDKDCFSIHRMTMLLEEQKEEEVISICTTTIKANVCIADAYRFRAKAKLQQLVASPNGCDPSKAQSCLEDCNETLKVDPSCVDILKDKLEVFLRLQMFKDARRLLESILDQEEEEEEEEEDTYILGAQEKEYFKEQETRLERLEDEEAKRNSKSSREDEIFQAILVRHGVLPSSSASAVETTSPTMEKTQEDTLLLPIEFKNPLAAFNKKKTSHKKKTFGTATNNSTSSKQQLLLKKCLKLKNDPLKMSQLITKHPANQVIQVIGSHLTEDLLVSLLEALQIEQKEAPSSKEMIDLLVEHPRFSLVKDMASEASITIIDASIEAIRSKQTQPSAAG